MFESWENVWRKDRVTEGGGVEPDGGEVVGDELFILQAKFQEGDDYIFITVSVTVQAYTEQQILSNSHQLWKKTRNQLLLN